MDGFFQLAHNDLFSQEKAYFNYDVKSVGGTEDPFEKYSEIGFFFKLHNLTLLLITCCRWILCHEGNGGRDLTLQFFNKWHTHWGMQPTVCEYF